MYRETRTRAFVGTLIAGAILLLGGVPAAAAGYAPNPSFDQDCTGVPCGWPGGPAGNYARDTTEYHSSGASMSLTAPTPGTQEQVDSACQPASPGSYTASGWYRRDGTAGISAVAVSVRFWSSTACTGFLGAVGENVTDIGGSTWNRLEGAGIAPAGTQSLDIRAAYNCITCGGASTIYFDDVSVSGGPPSNATAVSVASFGATRAPAGVVLSWRTGSENAVLGFRVWRATPRGRWQRLTTHLIPARGAFVTGYRYVDRMARRGTSYRYRLDVVGLDGASRRVAVARAPA